MRVLAVAGAAALTLPVTAAAQQRVSERWAAAPDTYIKIYNMTGSVRVIGWDRDSVVVTGAAEKGGGRFFHGGDPASSKLGFERQRDGRADLEVRVPARSTVWVKSASADVQVTGVTGAVDIYSVTGGIRVEGSLRQLYAESMGGDIELVARAPSIRARTGGGAIMLRGGGDDVTLATVEGRIRIAGPQFRRARFESVSGSILFEGDVDRGASVTFQSHGGAIELRLPLRVSADFTLSTFEGEVASELPLPRRTASRDMRGSEITFSSDNGGADIIVRTFNGPIVLKRRK